MQRNSISTPAASICATRDRSKTTCGRSAARKGRTSRRNSRAVREFKRSGILFTTTGLLLMSISPRYNHVGELVGSVSVAGGSFKSSGCAQRGRSFPQRGLKVNFLCFFRGEHALESQLWEIRKRLRRARHKSLARCNGHGGDKFGIDNLYHHVAMQVHDAAHTRDGMRQVQACSHVRKRQDRGVFNHCAAVNFRMSLYRTAAGNHRTGTNPSQRAHKSGRKNPRAFFNHGARSSPYAGLDFFSCRAGLCLPGKDVDGKLPQVASTGHLVQIAIMLQKRTLAAAMRQLCAEKRSCIISPRGADAEDFQLLLIGSHLRNPFFAVNVELNELFKINFSVSAKTDQDYQFSAALGHVIEC